MVRPKYTIYEAIISEARAHRNIRERVAKELEEHKLTVMEWVLLVYQQQESGVSISDLARILNVKIALASVMVTKQVDAGWLKKIASTQDSRLRYVYVTDRGKHFIENTERELVQQLTGWVSHIDSGDMDGYLKVVSALADA
jgi:DNA-binding MarR family transcriptional regulator